MSPRLILAALLWAAFLIVCAAMALSDPASPSDLPSSAPATPLPVGALEGWPGGPARPHLGPG